MWSEAGIYLQQKGLLCDRKGEHANVTPSTQEAPLMRLSVASLRRVVKGALRIEFVRQDLTSYGGLELLRRYVCRLGLSPATAWGVRSGQQRLRRRAAGPAHHELVLCWRPPPGAVALPD